MSRFALTSLVFPACLQPLRWRGSGYLHVRGLPRECRCGLGSCSPSFLKEALYCHVCPIICLGNSCSCQGAGPTCRSPCDTQAQNRRSPESWISAVSRRHSPWQSVLCPQCSHCCTFCMCQDREAPSSAHQLEKNRRSFSQPSPKTSSMVGIHGDQTTYRV